MRIFVRDLGMPETAFLERNKDRWPGVSGRRNINTGYLLTFCFNKIKKVGAKEVKYGNKTKCILRYELVT